MTTTTIRKFEFQVEPFGNFWVSLTNGEWEPEMFDVMDKCLTPSSVVFDIGAWVGPVTLYASKMCGWCFSVEPDPQAYVTLQRNVIRNGLENVTTHNTAIMGYNGDVNLGVCGNLGDSGTSWALDKKQFPMPCITLSRLAERHKLERVDFVKIDVEGAEESIVQDLEFFEKFHPIVHLSIHDSLCKDVEKAKEAIWELRSKYTHCYDGYQNKIASSRWSGNILLTNNEL